MFRKSIQLQKLERLGEGGQGEVYKALRFDSASGLNQIVALKILHSRTAVGLWRQEFESLARVRSHFCVRVLSFERYQGRPALLLEYVEGLSLARLAQMGPLAENEIEEILAQIEAGLADLHRFGVIHGDLSPQNVLVDVHGQVKLLDFGLANRGGRVTPQFAAPERLLGGKANERGDIFALGRIEDFLNGFDSTVSVYKDERRRRGLTRDPERARKLGDKVRDLRLRAERLANLTTEELGEPGVRILSYICAAVLACLVLCLPNASPGFLPKAPARVRVNTKHWYRFSLNGRVLGFAPLTLLVDADETQRLTWASAEGGGVKELKLHAGETVDLGDSDFSH